MVLPRVIELVSEAREKGFWIYCPTYKHWYSPDDFLHISNYVNWEDDFLNQVQIRNPEEGIAAGFERLKQTQTSLKLRYSDLKTSTEIKSLADLHLKLQSLVKMVIAYYKNRN